MDYWTEVMKIISKSSHLGVKDYGKGSSLIGRVPHVAPFAFLHYTYSPLTDEDVLQIENSLKKVLPSQFKSFLKKTNGLSVFSDFLYLYGMRKSTDGGPENKVQPYSIYTTNIMERPKDADNEFLFIGGYGKDGSDLYIDIRTGKVFHGKRYFSKHILAEWADFETMLLSETKRIAMLFDENGKKR